MTLRDQLQKELTQLEAAIDEHRFGEFGFVVSVHATRIGKIRRITEITLKPSRDTGAIDASS